MIFAFVVGLCVAAYLLGAHFGLPNQKYDGHLNILETEDTRTYLFEYDGDVDEIENKTKLIFSVGAPKEHVA